MAVDTIKSGAITNRDSSPQVKNNSSLEGGILKESVGTVETNNGSSVGSKLIMCSIPSNARVSQVLLFCDDIGTTTVANVGLYRTTADGAALVHATFFGSAVSLKDGAVNASDITHQSGVYDISMVEQPVWKALGLTADPGIMYDVVLTLTGAADAAATATLKVKYVI